MPVIESNMYVICDASSALIIDPHIDTEAENFLLENGIENCVILLTHEHFDHVSGVNRLRELFSCRVICTSTCANQITDPRKSGAAHFIELFLMHSEAEQQIARRFADVEYRCEADESYYGEKKIQWNNLNILLKEAPGHSRGSQIIYINDRYIFTGDSFVPGEKIILRLPGGSKREYEERTKLLIQKFPEDSVVYPGHNEEMCFRYNEHNEYI